VTRCIRWACLLAIGSCAVGLVNACTGERTAARELPNIVLIVADDHGWPYFGFMGDEIVETPHLDALAEEGVLFTSGYSTASTCRPSLRSLLTGLHPIQWGAKRRALRASGQVGPADEQIGDFETLPRRLATRGYASFQGGKFWEASYRAAGFSAGTKPPAGSESSREWAPVQQRAGGDGLELGRTTMEPLWGFLETHREEPFFVWFAPKLPHTPHDPPKDFLSLYADEDLSEPARKYYANITRFDARVGELVARLEKMGLREETLLVYVSDNGWEQERRATNPVKQLGGPKGKSSMYELGFRTPIIFSWPERLKGGRRIDAPVSTVDLFTTLLEFAGLEPSPDRTGISLRPRLLGEAASSRDAIIGSMSFLRPPPDVEAAKSDPAEDLVRAERGYFLRTGSWHYIWYPRSGKYGDRASEELYRIDEDPREEHDVVGEHPDLVKRFREEIERWIEDVTERAKSAT